MVTYYLLHRQQVTYSVPITTFTYLTWLSRKKVLLLVLQSLAMKKRVIF